MSVDGTLYDVTFVHGSYNSVYSSTSPFFLGNSVGATAAAVALSTALNDLSVTGLTGTTPDSFLGIEALITDSVNVGNNSYSGTSAELLTTWGASTFGIDGLDSNFAFLDQAVFTPETPVATPLPTALPLFATGLGGLGLLGWRRKRKARASKTNNGWLIGGFGPADIILPLLK